MYQAPAPPSDIRLGVLFLDKEEPDWWHQERPKPIDLERLDMGHKLNCILAQLYGSYEKGFERHDLDDWQAAEFGLQAFEDNPEEDRELTHAWVGFIAARRAEARLLAAPRSLSQAA